MKKILIIKHGALGDVILAMYPIFKIWRHFKGYEISVLTESKYKDLFECLPFIKDVKIDNRPKFYYFMKYFLNSPSVSKKEIRYVNSALKSNWLSSRGKNTKIFEKKFAKFLGIKYQINQKLVRGLDYYNHIIFEFKI